MHHWTSHQHLPLTGTTVPAAPCDPLEALSDTALADRQAVLAAEIGRIAAVLCSRARARSAAAAALSAVDAASSGAFAPASRLPPGAASAVLSVTAPVQRSSADPGLAAALRARAQWLLDQATVAPQPAQSGAADCLPGAPSLRATFPRRSEAPLPSETAAFDGGSPPPSYPTDGAVLEGQQANAVARELRELRRQRDLLSRLPDGEATALVAAAVNLYAAM